MVQREPSTMSDELERLANKGRTKQEPSHDNEAAYREYIAERLVADALSWGHWGRYAPGAVVALCVAGTGVGALLFDGAVLGTLVPVAIFAAIGLGYLAWRLGEQRAIADAKQWLEMPWRFSAEAYLKGLAGSRMNTVLSVKIRFEQAPNVADESTYADACKGAVELESCSWKGGKLHVRSGQIPSYFRSRDSDEGNYSNKLVHAWVRTLLDKAVRAMHGRAPVKEVHVKFEG